MERARSAGAKIGTVVICTYRREDLLAKCLTALANQTVSQDHFNILVVDNAGEPNCQKVAEAHGAGYLHVHQVGLSHARNQGMQATATEWVLYLDDDTIPPKDFIAHFRDCLEEKPEIEFLGGCYDPYFATPPPRWLLHYYREGYRPAPGHALSVLSPGQYLTGAVFGLKKSVFERVGPFAIHLGMTGKSFGYGEDDEYQDRAREKGVNIHYCPSLKVDHLIQIHKHSISSRIVMAYAHGIAWASLTGNTRYSLIDLLCRWSIILIGHLPYDVARWWFRPQFYWQNAVVSVGTKAAHAFGKFKGLQTKKH